MIVFCKGTFIANDFRIWIVNQCGAGGKSRGVQLNVLLNMRECLG